jgi:hypothetical protein
MKTLTEVILKLPETSFLLDNMFTHERTAALGRFVLAARKGLNVRVEFTFDPLTCSLPYLPAFDPSIEADVAALMDQFGFVYAGDMTIACQLTRVQGEQGVLTLFINEQDITFNSQRLDWIRTHQLGALHVGGATLMLDEIVKNQVTRWFAIHNIWALLAVALALGVGTVICSAYLFMYVIVW